MSNRITRISASLLLVLVLTVSMLAIPVAHSAGPVAIQVAICLDGSGSISPADFTVMKDGLAEAVGDNAVVPQNGTIELTVVQFGGTGGASLVEIPPTVVDATTVAGLVSDINAISKLGGSTPMAEGIDLAVAAITGSSNFGIATWQAINVSTDGEPDSNSATEAAVAAAVAAGIDEIDAEAIGSSLDIPWMQNSLVYPQPGALVPPDSYPPRPGKPGFVGFVRVVTDFSDYADAMYEKLRRITQPEPEPFEGMEVPTEAIVGGGGSPPFICAKFETPDHDPDVNGTQILPIAGGQRTVKFYVVAGDPNGVDDIDSVDVTVFYPNGTEKFQLRAIRGTASWKQIMWNGGLIDMDGDCTGETPVPDALDLLHAEGRITFGNDQFGTPMNLAKVKYDLEHNKQILIELVGEMDYHQPSCNYTVEAVATDSTGDTTLIPVCNQFYYISIVALVIDFLNTGIQFGTVNIDEWNYALGDADLGTPNRPTVRNIGNDPSMLLLQASAMVGVQHGKPITEFDAEMHQLDPAKGAIQHGRIEFPANVPTAITEEGTNCPVLLPPCTPTQIDFSVHPPIGIRADTYLGTMKIGIQHHPGFPCTD